jgi:glucosamine-6-phosphate deaminase
MGIRTIMMIRNIVFICNGKAKAAILRDAFYGPVTPLVPASVLQLHPSVAVIIDREAAEQLTTT